MKESLASAPELAESENLKQFIEGREIFPTKEILADIVLNTKEENVKKVADLLLSNKEQIEHSTVARGATFNGQGIGQALLRGSIEEPLVQVVIAKGHNEPVNIIKGEYEFIPLEQDREGYNRIVLHELLHSFTRYIVSSHAMHKEEFLNETERNFYINVSRLHEEFLQNHSTGDPYLDKLDEYIVKALSSNLAEDGDFDKNEFDKVYKEFEILYKQNQRTIQSISLKA